MIVITRKIIILISIILSISLKAQAVTDIPITTDSRIKTYIYNADEVYLMVLKFGYQSHIEFAKGEEIETISLGDTYSWKLTPLGRRLFIKALENNIRTNMTIITNKRTYNFDVISKDNIADPDEISYVVKFYYPKLKRR